MCYYVDPNATISEASSFATNLVMRSTGGCFIRDTSYLKLAALDLKQGSGSLPEYNISKHV
jgi:hypothetical protein